MCCSWKRSEHQHVQRLTLALGAWDFDFGNYWLDKHVRLIIVGKPVARRRTSDVEIHFWGEKATDELPGPPYKIPLTLPASRTQVMVGHSMADAAPAAWASDSIDLGNQTPPTFAELHFHFQIPRAGNSTEEWVGRREQWRHSRIAENSRVWPPKQAIRPGWLLKENEVR